MALPLEGLLVVAVEQAVAAPLCTARLRQAGARVIKIERAEGDFARLYDDAARGESSYFNWLNQGKESLVLDIKSSDDQTLLRQIIAQADVLVQNLAPGALARAGLDPQDLRQQHPALITCDISGYGDSPQVAGLKAYDLLVQAESGLVGISGGQSEPGRIGVSVCDIGAGMTAHAIILEALLARAITGKGRSLHVSLFDVAAEWMTVPFVHERYGNGAPGRVGLHHPSIAPYGAYATGDNKETLIAIQNEREWVRLCDEVFRQPQMAIDARFDSNINRVTNRTALDADILQCLAPLTASEFRDRLVAAGIAYGALNSTAELLEHRALTTATLSTAEGLELSLPASAQLQNLKNSQPEDIATLKTPAIGEHNDSIRQEFAGCS